MAKCNGCIHNAVCVEWSEEGLFPNISQERSPLNRAMQVGDYDCPYYAGDTYRSIRFATVGDNELVKYRGEAPMSEIFELLGADDLVWLYVTKQTIADVTERLDEQSEEG